MRKIIGLVVAFGIIYLGCTPNQQPKKEDHPNLRDSITKAPEKPSVTATLSYLDSVKLTIAQQADKDTSSYTFLLEGNYSAEGNEGKAFYKNKKIQKIEITFYGETGKAIYHYDFKNADIVVAQQHFNYKTNFTEVKSAQDIIKDEEINFTTDLNGKIIKGANTKADLDTFHELKKVVPFDLN